MEKAPSVVGGWADDGGGLGESLCMDNMFIHLQAPCKPVRDLFRQLPLSLRNKACSCRHLHLL
jgi:hypothetical protein